MRYLRGCEYSLFSSSTYWVTSLDLNAFSLTSPTKKTKREREREGFNVIAGLISYSANSNRVLWGGFGFGFGAIFVVTSPFFVSLKRFKSILVL